MASETGLDQYGPPITLELAKCVMAAAESLAERRGWAVTIAILDSTGHLAVLHKRDHAHYGSIASALSKAETALNFRKPTSAFQELLTSGALRLLSVREITAIQGGIPLVVKGHVVGSIGVSGVTADQDTQVGIAGVEALATAAPS